MTLCQTESFSFRKLTEHDGNLLNKLSMEHEKFRPLLGAGYQENRTLAHAYAKNKRIYPLANVITKKDSDVGIIILTDAGNNAIDICLMMIDDNQSESDTEVSEAAINDKQSDSYTEIIKAAINECRKAGIKTVFFSPMLDDIFANVTEFADASVLSIGTESFPEYQFNL